MTETAIRPVPSFADLRQLANSSPVARACIQLRKQEIRYAEWDIGLTGGACKRCSPARGAEARVFFRRPEPDYGSLPAWLDAALEDVLVTDSLAIYVRKAREGSKGLLGSDVHSLELIDGATLAPSCDSHGCAGPVLQYLSEVRRCGVTEMIAGGSVPMANPRQHASYGRHEVLYRPYCLRAGNAFGFSPLEQAIAWKDGSGEIDLARTEARMPEAFGLDPADLGLAPVKDADPILAPLNPANLREWVKSVFDGILHETCDAPDLEFLWLPAEGGLPSDDVLSV